MTTLRGAAQFDAVEAAMQAAGSVLRAETQRALQESGPAVIDQIRANASERLPKAGGLNRRVAADAFVVQDRSSILQAGIRIGTSATDARGSNRGRIRHPVYGDRTRWVEQRYEPAKGWFYDAIVACRPEVAARVEQAMQAAAEKAFELAAARQASERG